MEHETEPADTEHAKDLKSSLTTESGCGKPTENDETKSTDAKECPKSPSPTEDAKNGNASPARNSPEPSCAICLGSLQNKSFTDSCFHTFCFTCLVSWSRVKAECPLCKQRFQSIVHNVRSIEDYDKYDILTRCSESLWHGADGRRFRYSSTLTAERVSERRQRVVIEDLNHQSEYQRHRMEYAPHSVSVRNQATTSSSESTQEDLRIKFRQRIYNNNLWARAPDGNPKVRRVSPDFYHQNPACLHRLIPWLNRELQALLPGGDTQVLFILDLILSLIMRYDIRSQEFHVHVEPYLNVRTRHFVHEFFSYASSPHDVEHYDRSVEYQRFRDNNDTEYEDQETIEDIRNGSSQTYDTVVLSSPGSDVIPLSDNPLVSVASASTASTSQTSKKKSNAKQRGKRIRKIYLRRNQENNSWNVTQSTPVLNNGNLGHAFNWGCDSGPSTSRHEAANSYLEPSTSGHIPSVEDISSDEECQIVEVVKPRNERTPEIIDLITSSEDEAIKTFQEMSQNIDVNDGVSMLLRASEFADAVGNPSASVSRFLNSHKSLKDEDQKKYSMNCHPLDLSTKSFTREQKCQSYCSSNPSGTGDYMKSLQRMGEPSFCYSGHTSHYKEREDNHHQYSDSTDISGYNSEEVSPSKTLETKSRKSRLRSVVANVSADQHQHTRSDSSHHSSHSKKHKHKKKKKHVKHKHKHHSKEK